MPWLRARFRGKLVYARVAADGKFSSDAGRVEIRYNANDGRMYRAAERNLEVAEEAILPDDTCGAAEAPADRGKDARGKSGGSKVSTKTVSYPVETDGRTAIAYTDGACSGNPGPAGLGVVLLVGDQRIERYEYLGHGTNNVAELTAVVRALEELADDVPALIHTDSVYTIGVATKGWKAKANTELVAHLRSLLSGRTSTQLVYVKGHAGIELNERADELARQAVTDRDSGRSSQKVG